MGKEVFRDFIVVKIWITLIVKVYIMIFIYEFYFKCIKNFLKDFKQESDMNLLCFKNIYGGMNKVICMEVYIIL